METVSQIMPDKPQNLMPLAIYDDLTLYDAIILHKIQIKTVMVEEPNKYVKNSVRNQF